tara:strand:+ start:385 stop:2301 length:1917 start_codon:yes stop_codon:yes gene_type:complete
MAIGDSRLSSGLGSYNPNKNYFALPSAPSLSNLNIGTVPGQSKLDAYNALLERLGKKPVTLDQITAPSFSVSQAGPSRGQQKQQQMTVGEYDIGRKMAALERPNLMTQTTSALQDAPGDIFDVSALTDPRKLPDQDLDLVETRSFDIDVDDIERDPNLDVDIGAAGLGVEGDTRTGTGKDTRTDIGTGVRSGTGVSPTAAGETGSAKTEGAAQDGSTGAKRSNAYEQLLSSALSSYNEAVGRAPSGAKSMAEYKKEFSEATGIDISGDPDNKAALTAFGLALMQNKAGKGFNVGNILSEVGAAGEKALPLMEEARKEARAGQLAAGQYALSEAKSADAARQQFLVDQSNYLTKRRDAILDARVARGEKIEDDDAKRAFDRETLAIEYGFKNEIERVKAEQKARDDLRKGKKVESQYNREPQFTQLKIRLGFTDDGSREIFANPRMDGADVANAYVKLQRSQEAMGRLDALLAEIENAPSPSGQLIMDRGKNVLIALGVADPDQFYKDKGISPEDEANAILNVLIMENKRFATQETGNGISNQDRQDLAESFGQPGQLAANPRAARLKLAELRSIFDAPLAAVEQELANFYEMKDMYRDENLYNQTTSRMDEILNASPYQKIPNEAGDDGVIRFQQGDY